MLKSTRGSHGSLENSAEVARFASVHLYGSHETYALCSLCFFQANLKSLAPCGLYEAEPEVLPSYARQIDHSEPAATKLISLH